MFFKKSLFLLTLLVINTSNAMVSWDQDNDPELITPDTPAQFEYNFNKLPTQGSLKELPWTDSYWASYQRGIAARWLGEGVKQMPSKKKIFKMKFNQIKKLSPAEKYDLFVGDYDYSLTKSELNRTSPNDPEWEGLCHGWAMASFLFEEPNEIIVKNKDGLKIPFGSSDIKALLTYIQSNSDAITYFAGNRCEQKFNVVRFADRNDACMDINAGSFHVILANRIGILNKGFVFDVDTAQEVWNHPVHGYSTEIVAKQEPTENYAFGTTQEIIVKTTVDYTVEIEPSYTALNNTDENNFRTQKEYKYILELDKNNNIIGGKWISKNYPDFIWVQKRASFTDYFKPLEYLYKRSIQ